MDELERAYRKLDLAQRTLLFISGLLLGATVMKIARLFW
jgi:hypothetical protein